MARGGTASADKAEDKRVGKAGDKGPSFLDKRRAAWPWFDHVMRAAMRYKGQGGDHYAAAITYFTVLSLFPLLMVAFSVAGFVLAGNADLMGQLKDQIADSAPGQMGDTLSDLVDTAVKSRGAVGIIGLLAVFATVVVRAEMTLAAIVGIIAVAVATLLYVTVVRRRIDPAHIDDAFTEAELVRERQAGSSR